MGQLVFAYGYVLGTVDQDVGSHEYGVGEQSGVDVVRLESDLFFEGGASFQFTQVGDHVEVQVEFGDFWDVALNIDCGFLGVQTACQVELEGSLGGVSQFSGSWMCGEGVPVRDEEEASVFFLEV